MTTEEMNRVIAVDGMGWELQHDEAGRPYYKEMRGDVEYHHRPNVFRPDKDWNNLHSVWQKLRGELMLKATDIYDQAYDHVKANNLKLDIGYAILSCDITTAHRLIVEAIELIKK